MCRHSTFQATELLGIDPSDSNLSCLRPSCRETLEPTTRFEARFVLWQITCLVQNPDAACLENEDDGSDVFFLDREALLLNRLRSMLERLAVKMRCARCRRERGEALDNDDEGMVERWFGVLRQYLVADLREAGAAMLSHSGTGQAAQNRTSTSSPDSFAVQPPHPAREADTTVHSATSRLLQNSLAVPTRLDCSTPPPQISSSFPPSSSMLYTRPATPHHPISNSRRPLPFRLRPETTTTAQSSASQYAVQDPNLLQNNAGFSTEREESQLTGELHAPTTPTPRLMSPIDLADVTVYGDRAYVRRSGWMGGMERDGDSEVGSWRGLGDTSSASVSAVAKPSSSRPAAHTSFSGPALNVLNSAYNNNNGYETTSPTLTLVGDDDDDTNQSPPLDESRSMITQDGDAVDEDENGDEETEDEAPMTPKTWVIARIMEILRED